MARPTVPSVGDLDWGELLRSAIFDVSDRADKALAPAIQSAALGTAYTTTTGTGDTGLATTVTVASTSDTFLAIVTLDVSVLVSGATTPLYAVLTVNGVQQPATMPYLSVTATERASLNGSYLVTGLPVGSRTFKIQAQSATAAQYRINATNSTIVVTQIK
jgi:hypothetical protein